MYDQCNLWAILTVFLKQGGYLPISFTEGGGRGVEGFVALP